MQSLVRSRLCLFAPALRKGAFSTLASYKDPNRSENDQDKLLFTPGPLTTSWTTKLAATRDFGSRDVAFIKIIQDVRAGLLDLAGLNKADWTSVLMQGSGSFGVEGTISSVVPKVKGLFLIANGAYGQRMKTMCDYHKIPCFVLNYADDVPLNLEEIEQKLKENSVASHVAVVHSETTSGIINDIEGVGKLANKYGKKLIIDAMSSFGGIPVDWEKTHADFIISSANKCVEGIPGFSFVLARKSALAASKGNASSLVLDIHKQEEGLEKDGQFRYTPPTHSILAFRQALKEIQEEGGVVARNIRYKTNQQVLMKAMEQMGFKLYLKSNLQGPIISSYHYPKDKNWNFNTFYNKLNEKNFVIYPGKVSSADCFRIGHIGRILPADTQRLCKGIEEVCRDMKTANYFTQ